MLKRQLNTIIVVVRSTSNDENIGHRACEVVVGIDVKLATASKGEHGVTRIYFRALQIQEV
jgi:hypothetical protein